MWDELDCQVIQFLPSYLFNPTKKKKKKGTFILPKEDKRLQEWFSFTEVASKQQWFMSYPNLEKITAIKQELHSLQ